MEIEKERYGGNEPAPTSPYIPAFSKNVEPLKPSIDSSELHKVTQFAFPYAHRRSCFANKCPPYANMCPSLPDKLSFAFLDSLLKICILPAGLLWLFFVVGPLGQATQ